MAQKSSKPKRKRGKKAKTVLGVPKVKANKQANDVCHHCGKLGHWLRKCKAYLVQKRSGKGMDFIDINLSVNSTSWVLDTRCG